MLRPSTSRVGMVTGENMTPRDPAAGEELREAVHGLVQQHPEQHEPQVLAEPGGQGLEVHAVQGHQAHGAVLHVANL